MNSKDNFLAGGEQTLNNTGYMVGNLDPYSLDFVKFAGFSHNRVLDVGACYGIATIAALKAGAKMVVATDPEPKHLEILASRIDKKYQNKLECVVGGLPNEMGFLRDSFSAVLCSRVLHLLKGEEIEASVSKIYNWLERYGRLYIINDSPYVNYSDKLKTEFVKLYEQKKRAKEFWPGYIPNVRDYVYQEFRDMSPQYVTLTDVDTLIDVCKRCGFSIFQAGFVARPDYPPALQNDGRENAAVIAVKL